MRRICLSLCCLLLAQPALAFEPPPPPAAHHRSAHHQPGHHKYDSGEERELWSGSIYTSTFRCGFCVAKNGKARGVLLLKTAFGQVDEYHLYGTMKNGILDVRHSSGHHVKGRILDDHHVKGSITLGTGKTVSFKGKRTTGVRLAPSDCAPLP